MAFNKNIHWNVQKQPQSIKSWCPLWHMVCSDLGLSADSDWQWNPNLWYLYGEESSNTNIAFVSLNKLKLTIGGRWVLYFLVFNLILWRCFVASKDEELLDIPIEQKNTVKLLRDSDSRNAEIVMGILMLFYLFFLRVKLSI